MEVPVDLRGKGRPARPLVQDFEVGLGLTLAGAGTVEDAVGRLPQGTRLIEIPRGHPRPFGELRLAQPPGEVIGLREPLDSSTWAIGERRDELQREVAQAEPELTHVHHYNPCWNTGYTGVASPCMSLLPREANQRRVLAAGFADALGTGLFLPLTVAYLNRVVGLSPTQIGIGLAIAGFAAVAAAPVSGALVDRYDARAIVLGCFAISALGFLAYIAVDSFGSFVTVAVALQLASRMERPATAALVLGVTSGPARVDSLAWQQTSRNLGYGIGGLLAALALLADGKSPFVVLLAANAASYVVAGACVWRLPTVRPATRGSGNRAGYRAVLRDRPYIGLALLNVVVALYDSLLLVAMPMWILTRTSAPLAMTGLLFTLNTALVVLLQVRTARRIAARRGISTAYRTAALAFVAACVAFALTAGVSTPIAVVLLVIALAALTRGELESTSGEWFLTVELAPLHLRGRYLGLFKMSMALQQAIGPLVVIAAVVHWGRMGWIVLALVVASAVLASRRLAAYAMSRPTHADLTADDRG